MRAAAKAFLAELRTSQPICRTLKFQPTILESLLEELSFEIPEGKLFTLLGPNGAGKTTTVRLLLGLIAPDAGTGKIAGYELGKQTMIFAVVADS